MKASEPPMETTGAIYFFMRVLRVKPPLRIWLLPDSERATGNLLTRDDSGETFRGLQGRSVKAAPGLPSFPRWPPRESIRRLWAHVSEALTWRGLGCERWTGMCGLLTLYCNTSFLQNRGRGSGVWIDLGSRGRVKFRTNNKQGP